MRLNKILLLSLSALLITIAQPTTAETTSAGADFLVEVGERHYLKGEMESAIHEFRKALMLSPNHKKAQAYLQKLGLGQNTYSTDVSHQAEVARLARHIDYQSNTLEKLSAENERLASLDDKNYNLKRENMMKEDELAWLQNRMERVEDKLSRSQKHQITQAQDVVEYYQNNLNEAESRAVDAEVLQAKYYRAIELALNHEDRLEELSHENQKLYNYVNEQYAHQDKLIHVLEDYIHMREDTINDMKSEVTSAKVAEAKAELLLLVKLSKLLGINTDELHDLSQELDSL